MSQFFKITIAIVIVSTLAGCSTRKFLKEGEVLYTDVDVRFENKDLIDNKKDLATKLINKSYPKPADKFLGIAYTRQWMYERVNPKEGKTRGFKYFLKYKFGEKPVLLSDVNQELMNTINAKTMQDNGFFRCTSSSETIIKNQKGEIVYTIDNGRPSTIDSIIFPSTGSDIDTLIADYKYLRIKSGQRYSLENFSKDREELATYIRNSGYYEFDQKDLFYLLDTAGRSPNFDLYFKIKPPKDDSIHRKFYIRNVNIYVTDDNTVKPDSNLYKSEPYEGLNMHHEFPFISNKTLFSNTLMVPNHRFSIDAYTYTSGRFINMDIFDFVNVNYEKVGLDKLDVTIILNPAPSKSFSAGIEANTSNRSFLGGNLNTTFINKNLVHDKKIKGAIIY